MHHGRGIPRPRTAEYLRLLLTQEPYRSHWASEVYRDSTDEVNQAAVARVLRNHLWEIGEMSDADEAGARRLRDTVGRAIHGGTITSRTLEWFIGAFDFDVDIARGLRSRHASDAASRAADARPTQARPARVRIISFDDQVFVGEDGLPRYQDTGMVFEALVPVASLSFTLDTAATMEVLSGGTALPSRPSHHPGMHTIDLSLTQPRDVGETGVVRYRTHFHGSAGGVHEFRRSAIRPISSIVLQVQFDSAAVPARVWFCTWPDAVAGPDHRESLSLGAELSVHRHLSNVSDTLVGFAWEFD